MRENEIKRNHWEIENCTSVADIEEHINDEIITIPDIIAAIRAFNKFLTAQTIEERVLESLIHWTKKYVSCF